MNSLILKNLIVAFTIASFSFQVWATAEDDFNLGVNQFKAKQYSAAVESFIAAKNQGMASMPLDYNLASSYYKLGKYNEAKQYFEKVGQYQDMRDLADFNLGLIAIKQKNIPLARRYFMSVINLTGDDKLLNLSKNQLEKLTPKEDRLISFVSADMGYDDNISSASSDSVANESDTFYDLSLSANALLDGTRKQGWLLDGYFYSINYADNNDYDEQQTMLGIKKSQLLGYWETSVLVNLVSYHLGGDKYQASTGFDIKAKKRLSKSARIYLRYRFDDISSKQQLYDYLEGSRQRFKVEYRDYNRDDIKQLYYELELNNRGNLETSSYAYDYSPTRHTLRGKYTHILNKKWWLSADLAYRLSDYPASSSFNRDEDRFKLVLSADYRVDKSFKWVTQLQFTDNQSTVDQYDYNKTLFKIGLTRSF